MFYTGSVELTNYLELEEIKDFGCKQLGLSLSFDQLKFESLAASEKSNNLTPNINRLHDIFGAKKPTMIRKRKGSTVPPAATPQNNTTGDFDQSSPVSGPSSRFELPRYKPKPKKFKTSFEQKIGTCRDAPYQIQIVDDTEEMNVIQATNDRHDINYDSSTMNLTNSDDENDDTTDYYDANDDQQEGARLLEVLNGNDGKKKSMYSKINLSKILPRPSSKLICQLCPKGFLKQARLEKHMKSAHKDFRPKSLAGQVDDVEEIDDVEDIDDDEILDEQQSIEAVASDFNAWQSINDATPELNELQNIKDGPSDLNEWQNINAITSGFNEQQNINVVMSGLNENENLCQECGKTFSSKGTLKTHVLNVHTSEPKTCIVCEKIFKNKFTLKAHMKQQHKLSDEIMIYS